MSLSVIPSGTRLLYSAPRLAIPHNRPITPEEFRAHVWNLWGFIPSPLGLAISGGVDSMALAHLTHLLPLPAPASIHAFIIDHKSRPSNTTESAAVASLLTTRYNFNSHILPLEWKDGLLPSNFEMAARTARYRALANACMQHKVRHVLFAHHEDDMAETVLMRLLRSSRGDALAGFKPAGRMPETYGIRGAEKVQIGRPLLGVAKERLVENCKNWGVEWFEDPTNTDVTYTERNTVRHLLGKTPAVLPRALQKPSLLGVAEKADSYSFHIEDEAQRIVRAAEILVHRQWGFIEMELPEWDYATMSETEKLVMVRAFTRIAEKITPSKKVKNSSMLNLLVTFSGSSKVERKPLNGAGITWERKANGSWLLRRMPFFRLAAEKMAVKPQWVGEEKWSEWTLWDGRWWIRVQIMDPGVKNLVIRPMDKEDMEILRKYQIDRLHEDVTSLSGENPMKLPPGKFRFTLPLLEAEVDDNKEKILISLPSLQINLLNQRQKEVGAPRLVQWECEFRNPI